MNKAQAEAIRRAINTATNNTSDEQADTIAELFPLWFPRGFYQVGDRRRYEGVVWKCLQDHEAQENWNPKDATSLWARAHVDVTEWVQPTGASDAYQTGDKVTHNGKTWISNVDNNIWEPGVYGWDEIN